MTTKITLHTPIFILLTCTENFEIKTPKYWNDLVQNIIFFIKKWSQFVRFLIIKLFL